MKTIVALLAVLTLSTLANAATGKIGEYSYAYDGTPIGAPVSAIDPPPGSVVIDRTTGNHYQKLSAAASNATYAVQPIVLNSGTAALTLSGTVTQTLTLATLPAGSGTFVMTGVDVYTVASSGVTAAPTFVIQSGTATLLSATTTLSTTAGKVMLIAPVTPQPVLSATVATPIELRTATTGTATSITGKVFVRGYYLP